MHSFINELERPVGTYLYGRRMYEVMAAWHTMPTQILPKNDEPSFIGDFANIWQDDSRSEPRPPHARCSRVGVKNHPAEWRNLLPF